MTQNRAGESGEDVEMTSQLLVVGCGQVFEMAREICRGDRQVHLLELKSANGFEYDLDFLGEFDRGKFACAVALGCDAVNFPRMQVLLKVSEKGFAFASLVSRFSAVSAQAQVQKGVILGPNSVVHEGVSIGYGTVIHAGVVIGSGTAIKPYVSVLDCARLGANCRVGLGSTVGSGVTLMEGTRIGRHCELLLPGIYSGEIRDRTFRDHLFPQDLVVQDFRNRQREAGVQ